MDEVPSLITSIVAMSNGSIVLVSCTSIPSNRISGLLKPLSVDRPRMTRFPNSSISTPVVCVATYSSKETKPARSRSDSSRWPTAPVSRGTKASDGSRLRSASEEEDCEAPHPPSSISIRAMPTRIERLIIRFMLQCIYNETNDLQKRCPVKPGMTRDAGSSPA